MRTRKSPGLHLWDSVAFILCKLERGNIAVSTYEYFEPGLEVFREVANVLFLGMGPVLLLFFFLLLFF